MKTNQIETPALLLDLDKAEANIATLQSMAQSRRLKLRPHYKSHKSPYIAYMQIKAGAVGLTCAKLGEAEDLIKAGFPDVLIANQITDPVKISRLAMLARFCRLSVCVDDEANISHLEWAAEAAGSTIYCLVEYEVGMNRCGVETKAEFLHLVKKIDASPHLVFDGIQAYAGHIAHYTDFAARLTASQATDGRVSELIAYLKDHGFPPAIVSGASTGTAGFKKGGIYTELQAGSYVFMDGAYGELNLDFQNALFVLSQVISAKKDRIVIDAGLKCFGTDQGLPRLVKHVGAPITMSEEHIAVKLPGHGYQVGDKVFLIPSHGCTTVNLYDNIHLFRGDDVVG
ncbi:MAG: DSD1 family PLP-dependent enzyme, partial [Peptococcaceae bacterium]|nr:DSD1 family PLP-dependent enzyme [Peptococcaceae bacterium]